MGDSVLGKGKKTDQCETFVSITDLKIKGGRCEKSKFLTWYCM